ncbi:MAG: hypothetical protein IPJ77_16050 [Planctomycetes bacterium]|nr:hypothetical protein [Planctomycetota bacterium]
MRASLFAGLLLALPASADLLMLKDGRILDQKPMHRVDGGIEVQYEHGTILVPAEMIHDAVLEEDKQFVPKSDEEKAQTAKGMVRFEGKWITPPQRDQLVAKRVEKHKKSLEQMKARGEWRNRAIVETKWFRFEHTLPDHVFDPYREAMEAYFDAFAKTWKLKVPKQEDRLPVCFYVDEESFHQIGGVPQGVLGYFRFVKPWDLNIFYERLDPALTEDVMFHEANHYLQQLIDQRFAYPHFPGESLAEYYGASAWDPEKKKLTVGLVQEGRLCEVQTDIAGGNRMELSKLVTKEGAYEHYTWGWTLVHFLMNTPAYKDKFVKFFLSLPNAKGVLKESGPAGMTTIKQDDVLTVFMSELGIKDAPALRKLEKEWHDYIDEKLTLVTTTGLEKAAFKAKETGRKLRATRLFKEAIEKGSKNALVYSELAELYRTEGKTSEAIDAMKQALAIDPLSGKFYFDLADALERSDKAEAERLKALAKEIGYDDPWIDLDGDGEKEKPKPGEGEPPRPDGPPKPKDPQ